MVNRWLRFLSAMSTAVVLLRLGAVRGLDSRPHHGDQDVQFEVVTFRGQRVAVPLGEPLGKQLYACAALDALFKSSRGCDGVACSVMVELGGVGLCAFGLLKEPHHAGRAFHVQAQWRRLANISHVMAGNPANVILPGSGIPWPAGGPGPSLHQAAARLVGALTPVAGAAAATDVVVKVDMCVGCHSWLHTLLPVLATKRVGAVVLMFPERLTEGLLTEANSLVATAAMFGLKAFLGGFDGPPYHDRFHDPAASTAAPGPSGVFIARERAPPPTLHAFTPLHVADQSRHQALVNLLCHYLLDTAASSNFTVHVAGLRVGAGGLSSNPHPTAFKLPIILSRVAALPPTDLVMSMDAFDSIVQVSTDTLMQRYWAAGAPVFVASTEANCWPPEIGPWCESMGLRAPPRFPNKWVNSGGYIGRAGVVAKWLQDTVAHLNNANQPDSWLPASCHVSKDDQGLLGCPFIFGNRYDLGLDYESNFFYSLMWMREPLSQVSNLRWQYNWSSVVPGVIHANGDAKEKYLAGLRDGMLPPGYTSDPAFPVIVDGEKTTYGALCGTGAQQG
ncbi:hypothetical protein CHLRE_09g386143v5 [Chlamydomonas reinhardtii]|uniref:Uncharacterized protein n=1 Tax=Chlamydomonas reinhardtii TaxID=3055 RepID=A8J1C9_CHLRE|nr:uncharacterized protein CHLRE_09g386143v5 [Chlamydomonas reinhardtii]PNW78188.1 hypothetical protein CHLRE_09g386143v5 [Chlamydomonas reinhardtii]|eukprot:XP_001695280.1 predicted protein [Chlamydomonas reinhardtii]